MSETDPVTKAQILLLSGPCSAEYLSGKLGVSETTIYKYTNKWEDEIKESDAPISEVVGPVLMDGVFGMASSDSAGLLFGGLDP